MRSQDVSARTRDPVKGLISGLVAGVVASAVMNLFQRAWHQAVEGEQRSHGAQSMQKGTPDHGVGQELKERGKEEPDDNAPQRLAKIVSEELFDRTLTPAEKNAAATALHYAFGISTAGVYGVTAEFMPGVTLGAGLPFGAAVWVAADEVATPLLGLSEDPTDYPLSTHAYALSSHLVYGLTTETVRRFIRRALE